MTADTLWGLAMLASPLVLGAVIVFISLRGERDDELFDAAVRAFRQPLDPDS